LLTVISMVPAATAASTGITSVPPNTRYLPCSLLLPYIKWKTLKTSSSRRF